MAAAGWGAKHSNVIGLILHGVCAGWQELVYIGTERWSRKAGAVAQIALRNDDPSA